MAITVVTSTGQGIINGVSATLSFGSINAGDISVVATALTQNVAHSVRSSGGTAYTNIIPAQANGNLSQSVWIRNLSSFETACTSCGTGAAQDGESFICTVIRGAVFSTATVSSVAVSTTGSSANPNSPLVQAGSTNVIVFSIASQLANNTVSALPTGYSSNFNVGATDTRSSHLAVSSVIKSAQSTEDPAAYTFSASAAWVATVLSFQDAAAVYFPMPPNFETPPDVLPEMIPYESPLRASSSG